MNENGFEDMPEEELPKISMIDDNGEEAEFIVISSVESDGTNYLLVTESCPADADETDASILKEVYEKDGESYFSFISDDAEFEKCVELFKNCNDDYDIEI